MTKKDRPPVTPFSIQEAELLISKLHADRGEAIGNYDEFRFFTGLRPSEQIALLVTDYDARSAALSVTKAARVSCGETKTALRPRKIATSSFARVL
jgi:integrase